MARDITIIIPTYNRTEALRTNLPAQLQLADLLEIIVVTDRDADESSTEALLAETYGDEPRLRLIQAPGNGLSQARNAGIRQARGEWIIISDDDLVFPQDYAQVLKAEAAAHGADIMGAPWVHSTDGRLEEERAAALQRGLDGPPELNDHSVIPPTVIETPFMPAPALINRRVFERVVFYENYPGTGWRDETDFFIAAIRAGCKVMLSPATAMIQTEQWEEGGARKPRLEYEWAAIRNNWRFLRRHGSWLIEHGDIPSLSGGQLLFAYDRVRRVAAGFVGARLGRG